MKAFYDFLTVWGVICSKLKVGDVEEWRYCLYSLSEVLMVAARSRPMLTKKSLRVLEIDVGFSILEVGVLK